MRLRLPTILWCRYLLVFCTFLRKRLPIFLAYHTDMNILSQSWDIKQVADQPLLTLRTTHPANVCLRELERAPEASAFRDPRKA